MPALESAHAVAEAMKMAPKMAKTDVLMVNLSGRGDKDMGILAREMKLDWCRGVRRVRRCRLCDSVRKKPGIVAYLTAGDPDLATTREIALAAIDNGADVIELGVPFSDPLADGPVIQRASERAVARGTAADRCAGTGCGDAGGAAGGGIMLFSYLNPVVRMGMETFCAAAKEAGADGVLLTDMIVEEAGEYLAEMQENGLAPVFLAAPTSRMSG